MPFILISLIFTGYGPIKVGVRQRQSADTLTVERVIDGNTLELNDGRTVRLIGIESPEFKDAGLVAGYAQKAEDFLTDLVDGKEVRTEIDPINQITMHHDQRARFLAYLYVEDVFVNAEIIRQGYGVTARKFSFRYKDEFLELEQEAQENERGMWTKKGI